MRASAPELRASWLPYEQGAQSRTIRGFGRERRRDRGTLGMCPPLAASPPAPDPADLLAEAGWLRALARRLVSDEAQADERMPAR